MLIYIFFLWGTSPLGVPEHLRGNKNKREGHHDNDWFAVSETFLPFVDRTIDHPIAPYMFVHFWLIRKCDCLCLYLGVVCGRGWVWGVSTPIEPHHFPQTDLLWSQVGHSSGHLVGTGHQLPDLQAAQWRLSGAAPVFKTQRSPRPEILP